MGTKWDHEIYYILYLEAVASLTTKRSLTKSEKKGMTIRWRWSVAPSDREMAALRVER